MLHCFLRQKELRERNEWEREDMEVSTKNYRQRSMHKEGDFKRMTLKVNRTEVLSSKYGEII